MNASPLKQGGIPAADAEVSLSLGLNSPRQSWVETKRWTGFLCEPMELFYGETVKHVQPLHLTKLAARAVFRSDLKEGKSNDEPTHDRSAQRAAQD